MAKTVGKKSKKVRVAIIGVGNCASSLVQGVEYYKDAADGTQIPGMMHTTLGGYHIGDIEFSAAIDIDADKVGKDLSEAIFSGQNNTYQVRQRAQDRRQGGARHDARRPGQVSVAGHHQGARPHGRHREVVEGHQDGCGGVVFAGGQRGSDQVVRGADSEARAARSSTAFRCSSGARSIGRRALKMPVCR